MPVDDYERFTCARTGERSSAEPRGFTGIFFSTNHLREDSKYTRTHTHRVIRVNDTAKIDDDGGAVVVAVVA